MVSAFPLARKTSQRVETAPTQTGSKRIATIVLTHLGTAQLFKIARERLDNLKPNENVAMRHRSNAIWALESGVAGVRVCGAMTEQEMLQVFRDTGALLEGHFVLRSGLHSRQYFQCALALQQMPIVEEVGGALAAKVSQLKPQTVIAPAMGGLVLGQEVARQLRCRFIFVEKEEGKLVLRRGFKIAPAERILVVEDVVTKGGRVQETIDIVRAHGGTVVGIAAAVDRSNGQVSLGAPFVSLLALKVEAFEEDKLPPDLARLPVSKPGSK
jgi:orotate phosphoribosyltransferase